MGRDFIGRDWTGREWLGGNGLGKVRMGQHWRRRDRMGIKMGHVFTTSHILEWGMVTPVLTEDEHAELVLLFSLFSLWNQ